MARRISLLMGVALVALAGAACEGPVGPAGTAGPQGPQGPAGPAGPAGADAMNTCVQCHGHDTKLVGIEWQYRQSAHYETVYWEREGACMECHTHQGFITKFVNGQSLPANFDYPAPINCRTCHEIHTTFTGGDYKLTTTKPVDFYVGGMSKIGGGGNLCAHCHQARPISPMPALGGNRVTVPNFRWGPHYGTQGNVASATGAFHFAGTMNIPTGPNAHGMAGCETCHMISAAGTQAAGQAGGHTFNLRYGLNGNSELVKACTQCHFHANTQNFNDRNAQAYTKAQLNELRDLLMAEGIMRADGYAIPGTFDAEVAAAFLNHRLFYYDGSYGVHHPQYTFAVLNNTIQAMKARK
jgi:hypothetical protein